MKVKYVLLSIILILLAVLLIYSQTSRFEFTNWDDQEYVINNSLIREISFQNLKDIFEFSDKNSYFKSPLVKGFYVPLTIVTFALEFHFFGLASEIYHMTNVVLHILNGLLVFWLVFILGSNILTSLIVSLLFAAHPLHVESVAWISERKDVLYSFFYLGSMISYLYYIKSARKFYLVLTFFAFFLSLLAKIMAVTLVMVLFLLDFMMGRNINRKSIYEKIPFFLLSLMFVFILNHLISMGSHLGIKDSELATSLHFNVCYDSYKFLFYYIKLVFPLKLSCLYNTVTESANVMPVYLKLSPLLFLNSLFVILFISRYSKHITFGFLFFFITIMPVIQSMMADRFTYIPYIGMFYIFGSVMSGLYYLFSKYGKKPEKAAITILMVLLLGIIILQSSKRCLVWNNSLSLWSDVIKKNSKEKIAYNNRGKYYFDTCRNDAALNDFQKALALDTNFYEAQTNAGIVLNKTGLYKQAVEHFDKAVLINREAKIAYVKRGDSYYNMGNYDKALENYNTALSIDENYIDAYINRGILYTKMKNYNEALKDFLAALKLNPASSEIYANLGNLYRDEGNFEKARFNYGKAITINPNSSETYNNLGVAFGLEGNFDKATENFSLAIKLNPRNADLYYNMAFAFYKQEKYLQALNEIIRGEGLGYKYDDDFIKLLKKKIKENE